MLRIAVISLLVANLLLLGFRGSKPVAEPETVAKQAVVEDSSVPTIHLFSEMMNDQDLMSGSRRCFSLGPFHSVEDKNETRALLEDVSANVSERETQALVEKGYWVFMPPYESLLDANQALLSLQALGLKDIAVIYKGDWEKAISLGYFLRQGNALRRKKDLEDRGFAPKIRVQRQSESRYWLDYEQNPGSGLIAMGMQNRPNDFMQRSLPCPDQNPFESTASFSENLAAEIKQPQTQPPEEETQLPPEEIVEPQPKDISEPQPVEEKSAQQEDGGNEQSIEERDIGSEDNIDTTPVENVEVAVPEPASETEPEASETLTGEIVQKQVEIPEEGDGSQPTGDDRVDPEEVIGSTPVDSEITESNQATITEPENDPETELQNGNEAEAEASEDFVDDTLQEQVGSLEAGDESQSIVEDSVDPEESIDSATVDGEKVVPEPTLETEPENGVGTEAAIDTEPENSVGNEPAIETELENSIGTEPAIETEPENSVGTGPVISFGAGSEDGDETEPEDSNATEPEDSVDPEIDGG